MPIVFVPLVRIWPTCELGGLTGYNLNREGSCTVLPCRGVHGLELQGDGKQGGKCVTHKTPTAHAFSDVC